MWISLSDDLDALMIGTTIGPTVVSKLAGGMGEVYRARDAKLQRDVALKVLPANSADPDRLSRFEREARTLAALNHPHIAAIYGLEDSTGTPVLVMELVEGEDLAQRLQRGAIPIVDALHIASQIADALDAAHERGIVHRDLKPANVKLRPDGTVKVLDFGLAKLGAPDAMGATITSPALMTGVGTILGTAAYMSPEQARGQDVDAAHGSLGVRLCPVRDVDRQAAVRRRDGHRSARRSREGGASLERSAVRHADIDSATVAALFDERA